MLVLLEEILVIFYQSCDVFGLQTQGFISSLSKKKYVLFITQGKCLKVFMKQIWCCVVNRALYGMIHSGKKKFALAW